MGEGLLAEILLSFEPSSLGKALSLLGQHQVTLLCIRQAKNIGCLYQWEQIVEFQLEMPPKPVQVFAPSSCMNQLDQPRHIADRDMRQGLVGMWRSGRKRPCF